MKLMRIFFGLILCVAAALCICIVVSPFEEMREIPLPLLVEKMSYFTNQVAILCAVYLTLVGAYYLGVESLYGFVFHSYVKLAMVTYSTAVGMVYYIGVVPFTFFGRLESFSIDSLYSMLLHAVLPLAMLVLQFITPCVSVIGFKRSLLCLIYPTIYLAYLILYQIIGMFPIYPFLDLSIVGSAAMSLLLIGCIVVGVFFILFINAALHNLRYRKYIKKLACA